MSLLARLRASSPTFVAWALALGVTGTACRSKKPTGTATSAGASAPVPASSTPAAPPERCHAVSRGTALVVGTVSGPAKKSDEDEGDDPELPFATAIGSATALRAEFAVTGISAGDGGTEAFVALVPFDGKPGRRVSLGAVHGDPDPPLVAADGARALVVVGNSDAAGRVLELLRVGPGGEKPERGPEITEVGPGGAALAVGEKSSVVVWSAGKGPKTTLRAAEVRPGALGAAVDIQGTGDAESPVLRARPGGYFLAWISEKPAVDAGTRELDASAEETRPLDAVPRVLSVALLDVSGRPSGAARSVSGDASHVVAFDAVTLPDGALALAWREDDATPGVETGGTELARVAPDGAIQRGRAADETLSAGAPVLVREAGPPGRIWLLAPGEDDRLRMALVAPSAVSTSAFLGDDSLRGAEILAAAPGKPCGKEMCASFLLARAKDRAVELSVAECRP